MREEKIIKKITLLKQLEPSKKQLSSIKNQLLSEISEGNAKRRMRLSFFATVSMATIVFFTVALFINADLQRQNQINPYTQAKISLSQSQKIFLSLNKKTNPSLLLTSTAVTNNAFSHLHLQGEKGKYTKKECKAMYEQYYAYLSKLELAIKQNSVLDKNQSALKQIEEYKDQAEKKLAFYNS